MTLGALSFLSPWLLAGLVALPIIYWLLRAVPPRPRQIEFPPTRILADLENRKKTPDKTPWWLLLIRLMAAALVILALANPVLNADREGALNGRGPVVIVVDNGWSAAAHWPDRVRIIERMIGKAEASSRPVLLVATAEPANETLKIGAPQEARTRAAALLPRPFAPARMSVLQRIKAALNDSEGIATVWLTDGIDHGAAETFSSELAEISDAGLNVVAVANDAAPIALTATIGNGGQIEVNAIRPFGGEERGMVVALSALGERLSEAGFNLSNGATKQSLEIALPLELRNQVSSVAIADERSAGAVHLLDAGSRWSRVGLFSGTERELSQPLLGPLYYARRALQPYAELVEHDTANLSEGLQLTLKRKPSMIVMTDIGTITGSNADDIRKWVENGGVLVRFAGPRLEKGGDDLLPVKLRQGGRALGGALSWSTPQPLAAFPEDSIFVGLKMADEVLINRQVLADPARLGSDVAVWARLQDGTPLVTASRRGEGYLILFHVTASPSWSNLPLSGLFVEMLRRISSLSTTGSNTTPNAAGGSVTPGINDAAGPPQSVLTPMQILDGFGQLSPPPPTVAPIAVADFPETRASIATPPGYYGSSAHSRALNVMQQNDELKPLPSFPAGTTVLAYGAQEAANLKSWMLAAALGLMFIDVLAILLLQAGGSLRLRRASASASVFACALLAGTAAFLLNPAAGSAQVLPGEGAVTSVAPSQLDVRAIRATGEVTFGYVLTGNAGVDETSRAGLSGLSRVLAARTAIEPGEPLGIDIVKDEIAFFPILYWPVLPEQKELEEGIYTRIDAYMKQGGMIIFDTRDYGQGIPIGFFQRGGRDDQTPLQRLVGKLDIPRLEPVPQGHVLTKSFYLIDSFPGRWAGGQLWVEAGGGNTIAENRKARQADGVSSILITANDFASAWALDDRDLPLFAVVPGGERQREIAFRTGINIAMYALTGNYKADQVHIPALLERLGQ